MEHEKYFRDVNKRNILRIAANVGKVTHTAFLRINEGNISKLAL